MEMKREKIEKKQKLLDYANSMKSNSPQPKKYTGQDNYLTELNPLADVHRGRYQTKRADAHFFGESDVKIAHGQRPEPVRKVFTEKDLDKQISFLESAEYMKYMREFHKQNEDL